MFFKHLRVWKERPKQRERKCSPKYKSRCIDIIKRQSLLLLPAILSKAILDILNNPPNSHLPDSKQTIHCEISDTHVFDTKTSNAHAALIFNTSLCSFGRGNER